MAVSPDTAFFEALKYLGGAQDDVTIIEETVSRDRETGTTRVPAPGEVTATNVWRHPAAHPVVLDLLLMQKYGPEWLLLEPETLQQLIPDDFHTQALSELNLSKIQACKTLHVARSYWEQWEVFLWVTKALNGEFPDFEIMQHASVSDCLISLDIAHRIRVDVPWSSEMKSFLTTLLEFEGFLVLIPPLDFLHIPDHGMDVADVQRRWPEVRASQIPPEGLTMEDEQLRRMLLANLDLEESRTRLHRQLSMVTHVHP